MISEEDRDILNDLFIRTPDKEYDDAETELETTPVLVINLDEVNGEAAKKAEQITERLSGYYFDQKYIDKHPYIPSKISQEMDNIRRLLKMLTVNERAQDALISNITSNAGKGSLYQSLTSLQNAMLSIQTQLNNLTNSLEQIFREMQAECEKTFEEKDKEAAEDGSITVRGSRDFIKSLNEKLYGSTISNETTENEVVDTETGEILAENILAS